LAGKVEHISPVNNLTNLEKYDNALSQINSNNLFLSFIIWYYRKEILLFECFVAGYKNIFICFVAGLQK